MEYLKQMFGAPSPSGLTNQTTQPMTIGRLEVTGATHTRRSFLSPFFTPLVERNDLTYGELQHGLHDALKKLARYDIFDIGNVTLTKSRWPEASLTDVDVAIALKEKSRLRISTGTELGNAEGTANAQAHARNLFGGGESLTVHAAAGTRTRSAYSAEFQAPILPGNPDTRLSANVLSSAIAKPWSSYEELIKAAGGKITLNANHHIAFETSYRTITGLAATASPTVRRDAGDSAKNSITYTFLKDTRDSPFLPRNGIFWKSMWEIAGWGPLAGDVSHSKSEFEFSGLKSVGNTNITFGIGLRAGMLYPLPMGYSLDGIATPSRINDRFQLGGPSDIRGFKQAGLGPRDGNDAAGGDLFAAASAKALLPLPTRTGTTSNLRLQFFANGGRLVALKNKSKEKGISSSAAWSGMTAAFQDLCSDLPSAAVGMGLVFQHSAATVELNFSLPWVIRKGEEARKGLQVGIGINFM